MKIKLPNIGKIVECDYCYGDGLTENMKTCPKCNGIGSYYIE